jgi:hypothetical protein
VHCHALISLCQSCCLWRDGVWRHAHDRTCASPLLTSEHLCSLATISGSLPAVLWEEGVPGGGLCASCYGLCSCCAAH